MYICMITVFCLQLHSQLHVYVCAYIHNLNMYMLLRNVYIYISTYIYIYVCVYIHMYASRCLSPSLCPFLPEPVPLMFRVAIKELKLSYYIGEAIPTTIYLHIYIYSFRA